MNTFLVDDACCCICTTRESGMVGGLGGIYLHLYLDIDSTYQLLCWPGSAWFCRVYKADCSRPSCSYKEKGHSSIIIACF